MANTSSDSHSILQKLINNLSSDLRQLSTETKKKYPPIKEAAEACNMKLREYSTMKDNLSIVMRDASVDLLQPFVLGCDTKQVKIVQLCLTSIQKLLQHHIVNQASAAIIVNVLSALCELQTEELKILQTVLLLVNTTSVVVHSTLATLFVITFRLCFSKDPTIVNTSTAAVRQLVTAVYDRVIEEDTQNIPAGDQVTQDSDLSKPQQQQQLSSNIDSLRPYARDAYLLFQDLCYLINGDQPIWLIGLTEITRTLILELIETILTHYASIFHCHNEFRYLLKERVSPLVIKLFSPGSKHSNSSSGQNSNTTYDSAYFPLIARLLRVVCILIRFYFTLLITECEIFLSLLIKLLEPDKPVWQRSLAIECIHKIIIHQNLIKLFCLSYDMQPHSSKILRDLTNAISSYVQSYFNSAAISSNSTTTSGQTNTTNVAISDKKSSGASTTSKLDSTSTYSSNVSNGTGGSSNTILFAYRNLLVPQYVTYTQGQAKAVYVENWEKFDCPLIPDSYGIVVAYACMLELVRAVQSIIEGTGMRGDSIAGTQLRTSVQLRPLESLTENEKHECIEVVNCTWSSVLVTFTLLYDVCYDDTSCELLLRGFQTYISLCGMLGMNVQRDAFVTCLCKTALPPQYNIHLLGKQQNNEQQQQQQSLLQKLTTRSSVDSSTGSDYERQQVVIVGTPLPLLNSSSAMNQTAVMLTSKNIHCMRTLLSVAHCYGSILGTSWHLILTTLQHLVWIIGFKPSTGGTLKHVGTLANTDATPMTNSAAVVTTAAMADLPILSSMLSRLFESSVYLDDVALHHLIDALIRLSIESMEVAIIVREPSLFAIAKILETGRANLNRIDVWWKPISSHLLDVCQHTNPRMREWGTEAITLLVRNALEYKYEQNLFDNERLLHMIIISLHELSLIQHFDVRQKQLEATLSILTNNGPTLQTGWPIILNIIGSITREHNDSLIRQAQQCLQLVVTDFLSTIPICYLGILIKVVAKFGFQEQDLNIALSAIGLLWNMTDYLFRMKEQEHQLKNVNDYLDPNEIYDNLTAIEELWMILYRKLSELTIDQRPAIRKSASSTLFTMITSHGQLLSTGAWSILIWQVLFPLFEQVEQFFYTASKEREQLQQQQLSKSSGGQDILMHHSRDTPEKQWAETYVMILAGVTRTVQVKKDFLAKLDDFPRVWNVLLTNIEKSALAKNPEIALAALKSFNDLVNVPTTPSSSPSTKKILTPRDQQLWQQAWQVWLNIGNGCSRCPPERIIIIDRYDSNIPSQNFLTFYIDIFPNLISHIWSSDFILNDKHFDQFSTIIERVLAVPIHSDMALFLIPTDVNLTLLQESAYKAMEFVCKNLKLELTKSANPSALLPIVFKRLLVLVLYAINPPIFDCTEQIKKITTNKQQQNGKGNDSNVNFVPFGEKILRMTISLYEDVTDNPAVIENGTLQTIIQTLQIPLSMKYNCPNSSTWKLAIECFFRVLKVGLIVARKHRNAFESMWTELAKTFDDFLFSKSVPPTDIAIEELQRDEAIDCQAIELIRDDILPYANVLPEPFITKILNILNRGSIYSCATDNFIDIDSARRLREEFSKICFETLLKYSFINEPSSTNENVVITRLALSSMLNRCKEILQKYAHDERLHGKCPLPRPRTAEMISVLKALGTLIGALKRAPKDSVDINIWHQLIALYPCLVECTTSPSQQICNAIKDTLHQYFSLLTPPPSVR
ncbi:unnamed protein product [Adineta steineri]|uniref:Protein MON2 homolog n=1 Tax=Adineta steineri TaxID=433720 RepID=A0A813RP19_9BILA|nr:unnamed protein product [Adineta steineri]